MSQEAPHDKKAPQARKGFFGVFSRSPPQQKQKQKKEVEEKPKPHRQMPKMNWNPLVSIRDLTGHASNFKSHLAGYYNRVADKVDKAYNDTPKKITDFKVNYILPLGDQRVRLIILSVLSIPIWRISNIRSTSSALFKTRNLFLTFVSLGIILSPEIFNPFLQEYRYKPRSEV